MDLGIKSKSRRQEIRKNRPDAARPDWQQLKEKGIPQSLGMAGVFFLLAAAILMLRQDALPYHAGQPLNYDIHSRVQFAYADPTKLAQLQEEARASEPRVYTVNEHAWSDLQQDLLKVPAEMSGPGEPPTHLASIFKDPGVRTALRNATSPQERDANGNPTDGGMYRAAVDAFVRSLRDYRNPHSPNTPLILLSPADAQDEFASRRTHIRVGSDRIDMAAVKAVDDQKELPAIVSELAQKAGFSGGQLQREIAQYTLSRLQPTLKFDAEATTQRRNNVAASVSEKKATRRIDAGEIIVAHTNPNSIKPTLDENDIRLLRSENENYLATVKGASWKPRLGTTVIALVVTIVLCAYVAAFQPRVVKNHARAAALMGLLLSMLLLAALAGIGNMPVYLFGAAPTLLVGMILAIAYDRRFAIGIASLHGLLVTVALAESAAFFFMLWAGVLAAGFLLDSVRNRSKLVEVGGAAAVVMIVAAAAAGLLALEPATYLVKNCAYAGLAGLVAGGVVLCILPFIEKAFRITTSMTLLELADASQPLLRRLQVEAPGTYNHSMQVAILAEAAAEAIGADSLLCRVAAYYHDVGKINKPDYFVENQQDGQNRHLNLDPNLSLLIIVGHVKDGVELAREYNLPTSVIPFIQQHHGTTIVEYFYRRACTQQEQRDPSMAVPETQYRYPGPRPRTREVAIVMISDAVESATRALDDPTPAQIERLVDDLAMRRLLDGQFDECDITMKDLDRVKRALIKTLAGIYHGRIAYPATPPPGTLATPVEPQPSATPKTFSNETMVG
jgi:putative nucleotidyltransferase with HDIG domain